MVGKAKKIKEKIWLDDEEKFDRLVSLLKLEIDRILFDVEFRKDMLFRLWSKERTREPLLRALHSRFFDLNFDSLMLLPTPLLKEVDSFYRTLDELIFYVSYTEDMPHTMKTNFDMHIKELKTKSKEVMAKLNTYIPIGV
ncbi:MAG: hypothetical protein NTY22_06495 [Proteobacteria bacterium]|nr:hypothetical protein [Pseudomonadota bacterium]